VLSLGCEVWGVWFWGVGCGVLHLRCSACGVGFWVWGLGCLGLF